MRQRFKQAGPSVVPAALKGEPDARWSLGPEPGAGQGHQGKRCIGEKLRAVDRRPKTLNDIARGGKLAPEGFRIRRGSEREASA